MHTEPRSARAAAAAVAVAVIVAVAPGPARAAPADVEGAKAALLDGDRSFQLGRFEEAIQAYERAFSLDPQPAFLFNIGLAHRRQYQIDGKLEHLLRARELYRNYLKLDPTSPRRAGVEKVLAELDAEIDQARQPPPTPVAPPLTPKPATQPSRPPPPGVQLTAPPPTPAPPPSSSKARWLIIVGAAAVAAAVAAIVLATRSNGPSFDGPRIDLTPH